MRFKLFLFVVFLGHASCQDYVASRSGGRRQISVHDPHTHRLDPVDPHSHRLDPVDPHTHRRDPVDVVVTDRTRGIGRRRNTIDHLPGVTGVSPGVRAIRDPVDVIVGGGRRATDRRGRRAMDRGANVIIEGGRRAIDSGVDIIVGGRPRTIHRGFDVIEPSGDFRGSGSINDLSIGRPRFDRGPMDIGGGLIDRPNRRRRGRWNRERIDRLGPGIDRFDRRGSRFDRRGLRFDRRSRRFDRRERRIDGRDRGFDRRGSSGRFLGGRRERMMRRMRRLTEERDVAAGLLAALADGTVSAV